MVFFLPHRDSGSGIEVQEHRVGFLILRRLGDVDVRLVLKRDRNIKKNYYMKIFRVTPLLLIMGQQIIDVKEKLKSNFKCLIKEGYCIHKQLTS